MWSTKEREQEDFGEFYELEGSPKPQLLARSFFLPEAAVEGAGKSRFECV